MLHGSDWQAALQDRLMKRFHAEDVAELTAGQARAEIESLISRLALATNENRESVRGLISEGFYGKYHD